MQSVETRARMGFGFFSLFVLAGLLATGWGFVSGVVRPAMQCWMARNWVPTPCRIEYTFKPGVKPPSADVVLTYTYTFGGREYASHRYSFPTIAVVNENLSPGKHKTLPKPRIGECFVNPAQPEQAVINRRLNPDAWSGGIVLLVAMVLLGVAMMFLARGFRTGRAPFAGDCPKR